MKYQLLAQYRAYKEGKDKSEEHLAGLIYRQILFWIENGAPDEDFYMELIELAGEIDDPFFSGERGLLDLCLLELTEALHSYRDLNGNPEVTDFYLKEARLPLLARLDESSYRLQKNLEFNEIDFPIFEIIGGTFPHETAQNFLKEKDWVDIWLALRYLDSLEDEGQVLNILERMMEIRKPLPESLIILAYLMITRPEVMDRYVRDEEAGIDLGDKLSAEFIQNVYDCSYNFIWNGELALSYMETIEKKFQSEVLFCLRSMFEISQCQLSPAWIQAIEESVRNPWPYDERLETGVFRHQPLVEFSASILALLSEEELYDVLETSRILIYFFENLDTYTGQAFEDMLEAVCRVEGLFLSELQFQLEQLMNSSKARVQKRLQRCARAIGREVIFRDGRPTLIDQETT